MAEAEKRAETQTYNQAIHRIIKMQISPASDDHIQKVGSMQTGSMFAGVEKLPPDAIFFTKTRFKNDTDKRKINLGIGAYRTEEGKPYVLNVVKQAEADLLKDQTLNKEYLPIGGDAGFIAASQKSLFGDCAVMSEGLVAGVQTLSGTGALRICANFLANNFPGITVYKSAPTWANHRKVFMKAGVNQADYRYFHKETKGLDFEGMIEDLNAAPEGSAVLLHACAHNPTGVDPTEAQWREICKVMKAKKLLAFFDSAYQGYASGSLEKDAFAVRYFLEQGMEMVVAQSYSKNLGLYGERVGCASVVCTTAKGREACDTQLRAIIRPMYSNPPKHGCYIAKLILTENARFEAWKKELEVMSGRILEMRTLLRGALERKGCPGSWNHITEQIGMFSYTGLTAAQVDFIEQKYHVYMLKSGRVSMAGVTTANVGYIADAIVDAVKNA